MAGSVRVFSPGDAHELKAPDSCGQQVAGATEASPWQLHAPATHVSLTGQRVPHAPQLVGAVTVSTHASPQRVSPEGQGAMVVVVGAEVVVVVATVPGAVHWPGGRQRAVAVGVDAADAAGVAAAGVARAELVAALHLRTWAPAS